MGISPIGDVPIEEIPYRGFPLEGISLFQTCPKRLRTQKTRSVDINVLGELGIFTVYVGQNLVTLLANAGIFTFLSISATPGTSHETPMADLRTAIRQDTRLVNRQLQTGLTSLAAWWPLNGPAD